MNNLTIKSYLIIDKNNIYFTCFHKYHNQFFCVFNQEMKANSENSNDAIINLLKNANTFLDTEISNINIIFDQQNYEINNNCQLSFNYKINQNEIFEQIRNSYKNIKKFVITVENCEFVNNDSGCIINFNCLTCNDQFINNLSKNLELYRCKIESVQTEFDLINDINNPILSLTDNEVYLLAKLKNNTFEIVDYSKDFESMLIKMDEMYDIGFEQIQKLVKIIDSCRASNKNFEIAYFAKNKFKIGNYVLKDDFVNRMNICFNEFLNKISTKPILVISDFDCWNNKNCLKINCDSQLSRIINNQKKCLLLENALNNNFSLIKFVVIDNNEAKADNIICQETY